MPRMLSQDYLSLRLIRLKNSEHWTHEGAELAFILPKGGSGILASGSAENRLNPGDVVVLNGALRGKISVADAKEMAFWFFSANLENLFPLFGCKEVSLLQAVTDRLKSPRLYPASTPLALESHKLLKDVSPQFDLNHRGQLLRVVAGILSAEFKNLRPQRDGFVGIEDHINQVFEKMSISEVLGLSVGELAARFSCSRRHLNRLFHQHFGLSVAALRMEMRLLKAVSLLRDPGAKIINVAEQCGFNHLGLFNTCFKRRFGITPGHWRKSPETPEPPRSRLVGGNPSCRLQANGMCPWMGKHLTDSLPLDPKELENPKPLALGSASGHGTFRESNDRVSSRVNLEATGSRPQNHVRLDT